MIIRGLRLICASLALVVALSSQATFAQERTALKDGFVLKENSGKKIVVFRPKVSVGAQSTGGMFEPNAEWTEQAKANIESSLKEFQRKLGNEVVVAPDVYGQDAVNVEDHMALFAAIADAVIEYQFFLGNRLPTKKLDNKEGVFDLVVRVRRNRSAWCGSSRLCALHLQQGHVRFDRP